MISAPPREPLFTMSNSRGCPLRIDVNIGLYVLLVKDFYLTTISSTYGVTVQLVGGNYCLGAAIDVEFQQNGRHMGFHRGL
jgi:hypothetical protein